MQPREPDPAWAHEGRVSRTGRLPGEAYWREGHSTTRRIGGAFWVEGPVAVPVRFAVQVAFGADRLERRPLAPGCVRGYHASHGTEWTAKAGFWRLMATSNPWEGWGFAPARRREAYRLRPPQGSAAFAPRRQDLCFASVPEFWVETFPSAAASVAAGDFVLPFRHGGLARSSCSASLAVFALEAGEKRVKDAEWIPDASWRAAVATGSVSGPERVLEAGGVKAELDRWRQKTAAPTGPRAMIRADAAAVAGHLERVQGGESWLPVHDAAIPAALWHPGAPSSGALALRALPPSRIGRPAGQFPQDRMPAAPAAGFTASCGLADWSSKEAAPRLTGPQPRFPAGLTPVDWRPASAPMASAPAPAPVAAADSGRAFAVPAAGYEAGRGSDVVLPAARQSYRAAGPSPGFRRPEGAIRVPRAQAGAAEKPHEDREAGWRLAAASFGFPASMPDCSLITDLKFWPASTYIEMAAGSAAPATFRLDEQRYAWAAGGCTETRVCFAWEWNMPKAKYLLAFCSRQEAGAARDVSLAPGAWVRHSESGVNFAPGLAAYAAAGGRQGWKPQASPVRGALTPARVFSRAVELEGASWRAMGESVLPIAGAGIGEPAWGGRMRMQYRVPEGAPAARCGDPPAPGYLRPDRLRLPHLTCRFPRTGLSSGIGRGGAGASFSHLPGVV
jgi:hypothetical protein